MLKNKLSVVQSKYLTKKETRIRIRIWIIKPGSGSWKKPGSTQIRIRHTGTNHHPAIFFSLHNAGGGVALVELLTLTHAAPNPVIFHATISNFLVLRVSAE